MSLRVLSTELAARRQRYRAAGGTRAIATNIAVDLSAPTTALPDGEPFHLRCAPRDAAERMRRLAELGFDETILVHRGGQTESDLAAMRALVP